MSPLGDAQSFREFELRLVALTVGFALWIAVAVVVVVVVSQPSGVPHTPGPAAIPSPLGAAATP